MAVLALHPRAPLFVGRLLRSGPAGPALSTLRIRQLASMTHSEAEAWTALQGLASGGHRLAAQKLLRERTVDVARAHMTGLGISPESLPPVLHIAGTKGKGSTGAMVESCLNAAGFKTLLFTSPHLTNVRERFRIDGGPVDADTYLKHFWPVFEASVRHPADASLPPPSYFMLLTLLAFRMAIAEAVDALVLEVGIGGRTDATNAVGGACVAACGITTLDWDHTDVLGSTLPEIAAQKAGIFKRGVPAFTVPQRPDALETLQRVAAQVGTSLQVVDPATLASRTADGAFPPLALEGEFQRTNAALAVAMAETFVARRQVLLAERDRRSGDGEWRLERTAGVVVPGASSAGAAAVDRDESASASATSPSMVVPVYAPPHPLPAWVTAGLANAAFPGRAQVVPLFPAARSGEVAHAHSSGSAGSTPISLQAAGTRDGRAVLSSWHSHYAAAATVPAAAASSADLSADVTAVTQHPSAGTVYVDGAHTERSMRRAVDWFCERVQRARDSEVAATHDASAASGRPVCHQHRMVLVFGCSVEKDALSLLLPLTTVPFDAVYIAGIEGAKPSTAATPTADAVLAGLAAHKIALGDTEGAAAMEAGLRSVAHGGPVTAALSARADGYAGASLPVAAPEAMVGSTPPSLDQRGGGTSSPAGATGASSAAGTASTTWQTTLAQLYQAAHERPELQPLRLSVAQPLREYAAVPQRGSDAHSTGAKAAEAVDIRRERADAATLPPCTLHRPAAPQDASCSREPPARCPPITVCSNLREAMDAVRQRAAEDARQARRCPAGEGPSKRGCDASSEGQSSGRHLATREIGSCDASATAALPGAGEGQTDTVTHTHVLVTGSLYLVGSALQYLGAAPA